MSEPYPVSNPDREKPKAVAGIYAQRVPPNAPEAERGVLEQLIAGGQAAVVQCASRAVDETWFYHPMHVLIYGVLMQMHGEGLPVDYNTVSARLREMRSLDSANEILIAVTTGGGGVLMPALLNLHLDTLADKRQRRRLVESCAEMLDAAFDEQQPWLAGVEKAEGELLLLREQTSHKGVRHASAIMNEVMDDIHYRVENQDKPRGLATGFADLDRTLNGIQEQWFVIVAARPAMGKTSLATGFAEGIAIDQANRENRPVLICTLEMSDRELGHRILHGRAGVGMNKARTGHYSRMDMANISGQVVQVQRSNLWFYDGYDVTLGDLRSQIQHWLRKIGWTADKADTGQPPLVIIDYLQLIRGTGRQAQENIRLAIVQACAGLKGLAKKHRMIVMAIAQAGRSAEENKGKEPGLKDLLESGAMDQFGDVIGFVHRDPYYTEWKDLSDENKKDWEAAAEEYERRVHGIVHPRIITGVFVDDPRDGQTGQQAPDWRSAGEKFYRAQARFIIRKGRDTGIGSVPLLFIDHLARFYSLTFKYQSTNANERQMRLPEIKTGASGGSHKASSGGSGSSWTPGGGGQNKPFNKYASKDYTGPRGRPRKDGGGMLSQEEIEEE